MATHRQRDFRLSESLPQAVDRLAQTVPEAEYGEWVTGSEVLTITYAQLANIINGLTWWLIKELRGSGFEKDRRETLAYLGPNDVRCTALVLAAVKAGYVILVTSPRNSQAGQRALFDRLGCQSVITTDPILPPARAVLDTIAPARHLTVPSLNELISHSFPPHIFERTFEAIRNDPVVVMHTSGTTGLPKPITWTHESFARAINSIKQNAPDGHSSVDGMFLQGKRIVVTLPPFHGALLSQFFIGAIPYGNVIIAPVATAVPTAQGIVDVLKKTPADVALLVPSVVAELAQNPELLEFCSTHLEAILYIGGDLPRDFGDRVAAKIYLRCQWGASEVGIVPQLLPPELLPSAPTGRELWHYVKFHPCVGAIFDEVSQGEFELVIQRDDALERTQTCFTVSGIHLKEEYRTKDLFEKHPDIPGLWRWCARADDIIVFLNGEKTNPLSMENYIITSNPEVRGALVIGTQRLQAALLLEPASEQPLTTKQQAALIERVWPSVNKANESSPAHARVEKSFILLVPAGFQFIRSGKGSIMRSLSIGQCSEEIEKLYATADDLAPADEADGAAGSVSYTLDLDGIMGLIRQHARVVTGWMTLNDTDNFFECGMDSLQGLQLTRALRRSLYRPDFALSSIYQNPSVFQLARRMLSKVDDEQDVKKIMGDLLSSHSGLIQEIPVSLASADSSQGQERMSMNAIVTGSTGVVGTQLLYALLIRAGIERIFCLNRAEDGGKAAQHNGFINAELPTSVLDSRVTFIKADLQQPKLGLDKTTYKSICARAGLIFHTAWPVNFNLALPAFRPQLTGIVNLFALAAATSTARVVFVSSVAAVEGHSAGPAPETILDDFGTPGPFGYGQAKFLGELLVDAGARHFQRRDMAVAARGVTLRVGQIAGEVQRPGIWNPKEWLPSLVMSSLYLGQVPSSLGSRFDSIDFIPADKLGDILIDLATTSVSERGASHQESRRGAIVFNIRNPHVTPWHALLPAITDAAEAHRRPVEIVPLGTWLATLRASSNPNQLSEETIAKNPAVKLLDFFSRLWALDLGFADAKAVPALVQPMAIEAALEASPALRKLEAVGLNWMRKWVNEWIAGLTVDMNERIK